MHKGLNKFCKKENYVVPFLQLLLQLETQHLKCYVFVDLNRKLEKKKTSSISETIVTVWNTALEVLCVC